MMNPITNCSISLVSSIASKYMVFRTCPARKSERHGLLPPNEVHEEASYDASREVEAIYCRPAEPISV